MSLLLCAQTKNFTELTVTPMLQVAWTLTGVKLKKDYHDVVK